MTTERDKLIVEALGGCFHTWKIGEEIDRNTVIYKCMKCKKEIPQNRWLVPPFDGFHLDFTTWDGFGWIWERVQKMKWFKDFWTWLNIEDKITSKILFVPMYIHPTRFRDALADWLKANPEKWRKLLTLKKPLAGRREGNDRCIHNMCRLWFNILPVNTRGE